jgi:hypothetical protein
MQAIEIIENDPLTIESRFSAAHMRALRRKAMRIHAGVRSSTEILNALAARVERDPIAMMRNGIPDARG